MRRTRAPLLGGVLLAAIATGCGAPEPRTPAAEAAPQAATYSVRGVLRRLPSDGAARRAILLQHEAVPDLVDLTGEVVGMDPMTMEFDVAPEVDLSALAPGDKVRFELEVDWDAEPPAVIRGIERLPAETELEL